MKRNVFALTVLALGAAATAFAQAAQAPAPAPPVSAGAAAAPTPGAAPTRIAIIQLQKAIVTTQDGQKASADMNTKFGARRSALEKRDSDLKGMQDQLNKGGATMTDAARQKLTADLTAGQKSLQRDGEDFDSEVSAYENKIMQDLATKMVDVIAKYATQNGYAMVVDVSNQQSPLIWADQANVITDAIIKLYDQAHPGSAAAPAAAAPAPPVKPPATPPGKKQ